MLLVLGLVPLVGSIVVFALPRGRDLLAKQVTLLFSLATLGITIGLCVAFTVVVGVYPQIVARIGELAFPV